MQRARLPVTGDLIEYRWYNRGAADVTLVLLHEGLGCTAMWKQFPQRVAALTACPVFVYSRAGYGGSSAIELPRPIDFHTSEAVTKLPALLDAAGIGACILIGHSDGATIALVHAGRSSDPRLLGVLAMAPHVRTEAKTLETIAQAARSFRPLPWRKRRLRVLGLGPDLARSAFRRLDG